MMASVVKSELVLAALGVVAVVLVMKNIGSIAQTAATATVDAVKDAATGVVLGAGDALGVPRTDETECEKAMREGRTWDASFACPASTFIDYTIHGYIDPANKGL
ncbi:hypothetical protein [Duganella sp. BJB476]|uniref:hypothetical protein n=1 Tax=Duganella sp. BJB476 TaxID=1871176 RepID=UPI000EF09529|nr:hypothetical protein [Duganella sp. BJB476]RFP36160.1 hypothetical protein D0T21_06920 [Duganella sp. BJB476]